MTSRNVHCGGCGSDCRTVHVRNCVTEYCPLDKELFTHLRPLRTLPREDKGVGKSFILNGAKYRAKALASKAILDRLVGLKE